MLLKLIDANGKGLLRNVQIIVAKKSRNYPNQPVIADYQ